MENDGRRLRIVHRTGYSYGSPVAASFNEARMTPLDGDGQVLISHDLVVEPRAILQTHVDYWGALVEAFDVHQTHRLLEIIATSTVDTIGEHYVAPGVDWEVMRSPAVVDRWCESLAPSAFVDDAAADPARAELVGRLKALPTPSDVIRAVMVAVQDQLDYTPGITSVSTTAGEAWASGHGVCQDFTHATLSLLRAVGIPARYVSGYLHTEEEALGETVVGESHAWVEVWNGGWEAYDPTNERRVGPDHVTVARGRDYADVPPLKGIYSGGTSQALGVSVEITQLPR